MALYDPYGRPIDANASNQNDSKQGHQGEYANPAKNHAADNTDGPTKSAISDDSSVSTEKSQPDTDDKKRYRLQQWGLFVQAALCIFTAFAFGAAAYYAWIAKEQLEAMTESLNEAHVQNVAQQRALLVFDGDPMSLVNGDIGMRIRNMGHMAATITSYTAAYAQSVTGKPFLYRERRIQPNTMVTPEDPAVIDIKPPVIPHVKVGDRYLFQIDLTVSYKDGFGNTQHVHSCLSLRLPDSMWEKSCMWVNVIDLSKDNPPATSEKQNK